MEAAVNCANKKARLIDLCWQITLCLSLPQGIYSSRNCLGLRSCDHHAALGVVYYPSGADMQQISIHDYHMRIPWSDNLSE